MRLDDYQREALRTATPITDFTVGPHLSCAALGLSEECAELLGVIDGDASAAEKEAGDVLWYLALLAGCLNLRLSELCHCEELDTLTFGPILTDEDEVRWRLLLMTRAAEVAGAVKKAVHHRAGIPNHLGTMRSAALDVFEIIAALADNQPSAWNLNSAAARNVDKLRARYPDGWSARAAAARADERGPA